MQATKKPPRESFTRDAKFSSITASPAINEEITKLCKTLENFHLSSPINNNQTYNEINLSSLTATQPITTNKIIKYPLPGLIKSSNKHILLLQVKILENVHTCLLDTGAEICVFGKDAEPVWSKFDTISIFKKLNIRTAGDEIHPGIVKKIPIEYDNETKLIQFVFAPSIAIPIALGMNFCKAWNIKLMRITNEKLSNDDFCEEDKEINYIANVTSEEEYNLTAEQKIQFDNSLQYFNFSDGDTLGCQNIMEHKIDTGDNSSIFCLPYRYNPKIGEKN